MVLPEDINNNMNMGIKRSNESNSNESKKVCCDNKDNDIKMEEAESQNTIECQPQNEPVTTGGCKKQGGCCKKQGGGCPGKQGGGCGGCCKRRAAMMAAAAASDNAENQSEVKPEGQSSPCGGCPRKQSGGGCPGKQGGGCGGCCKRRAAMMAAAAASDSAENQSEVKPEGQSSPCGGCPRKQSGGSCPGKQGGGCGGCCKRRAAMMAAAAASDNAENQSEVKPEGQSSPCGGCPRKQSGGGCPGRQGGGCCKKQGGCSGCPGKQGGCCRNQGGSPCANCPGKQGGCCRSQGGSPCANCPGKQGGCCRSQGGSPCANCPNRNFCPSASANAGCPGIDSENRGMASACEGCPNRAFCMSNKIVVDPDLDIIKKKMETIKHKVLILSGKGGVGKSTLSSQLAYTIGRDEDIQIGLCDVDITGPSQPIIMGAENEPVHQSNTGITPVYVQDNLAVMSIGFLLEKQDESVIWRGPKKNGLIKHFLKDVEWGDLDLLLFDTPPGTSDEHLSIVQYLKGCDIDGAILISTPQEISIQDVRKEINFCKKVNMPILGIVENMSGFVCPSCKGESIIFPATNGGVKALCEEINVPFLGAIPLDPRIVNSCDVGEPFVDSYPESPASKRYIEISKKIKEMLNLN